jgi:hypothetical protein
VALQRRNGVDRAGPRRGRTRAHALEDPAAFDYPRTMDPTIVETDHVLTIAHWQHVQIHYISGSCDLKQARAIHQGYLDLAARFPGGIASVSIGPSGAPLPSSAARKYFAHTLKDLEGRLVVAAVVVEGAGVWLSVAMTVIRAVNVIAKQNVIKIFANRREAIQTLAPMLTALGPQRVTELALAAAIDRVEQTHLRSASARAGILA